MLASPRWATKRRYRSRAAHTPYQKSWLATPPESGSPLRAARALPPGGEELGWEDARKARFRTAAQMVEMWRGLDLPAWEAPYVLRDARLGYLNGYERALISGEMSEQQISYAAESRWGERWRERLRAARERSG